MFLRAAAAAAFATIERGDTARRPHWNIAGKSCSGLAAPPAAVEERGNLLPRKLEDLFSELLDLAFERFVAVHAERLA
jgi:hypothetical protein